ncbi:hypothetical protein EON83_30580, partial [bacterium]
METSAGVRVWISDTANHRIRMVDAQRVINTFAGSGAPDFSGDGGPARVASLHELQQLAVLPPITAGNNARLWIADTQNDRNRFVSEEGTIYTFAGSGVSGFGGDGGPAIHAKLRKPRGIAVLEGPFGVRVWITDTLNARVRLVTEDGIITTIVGTGSYNYSGDGGPAHFAQLHLPIGVAVLAGGNDSAVQLWIGDIGNGKIRHVDENNEISTLHVELDHNVAGDDPFAITSRVDAVGIVAFRALTGSAGVRLWFADQYYGRVRYINENNTMTTVVGKSGGYSGPLGDEGPATNVTLEVPSALGVLPQGSSYETGTKVWIADTGHNRVRFAIQGGNITKLAGKTLPLFSGDGGPAVAATFQAPSAVAVLDRSNGERSSNVAMWIADTNSNLVRFVSKEVVVETIAGTGGAAAFSGDGGLATNAALAYPRGLSALPGIGGDKAASLWIADTNNCRIRFIAPDGIISTVVGTDLCARAVPAIVACCWHAHAATLQRCNAAKLQRCPSLAPP